MRYVLGCWILLFGLTANLNAQKVRWACEVENSLYGAGVPWQWTAGFNKWCAAPLIEDEESEVENKASALDQYLHYHFQPFTAEQLIVIENYNPGAITKIEIGYGQSAQLLKKEIYIAEAKSSEKEYQIKNIFFERTEHITNVWIYMDVKAVPGVNQIAGVALANFGVKYTPVINLPAEKAYKGNPDNLNDDAHGRRFKPTSPIMTIDYKHMYFNHFSKNTQIYNGIINDAGIIDTVIHSKFNIPVNTKSSSAITSISQDNNNMYVNSLTPGALKLFKTYQATDTLGNRKWHFDPIEVLGYKNDADNFMNEIMSYDGKYLICRMNTKTGPFNNFKGELYIFEQLENGNYGNPKHMGFDINSIWDEVPCFLAPDNKTLYFASNGHLGYGKKDLFVTRRLDNTWQNWTMPINMGKPLNTSQNENYLCVGTKGDYVYFVRWKDKMSDIYRLALKEPSEWVPLEKTVLPEPVIIISGTVIDKKYKTPLYGKIIYTDLNTGLEAGQATSNAETGEYTIALPKGCNYSFEVKAYRHYTEFDTIVAKDLRSTEFIERNYELIPLEVGQTIRLNNIFFETASAKLKMESDMELTKLLKILQENNTMKIEISGHTDHVGTDEYNQDLSDSRAKSVVRWLLNKGINKELLVPKGYGESKPVATNETEEGRALNRRVEFTILEFIGE